MFDVVLTKRAEKSFSGLSEEVQNKCGDISDWMSRKSKVMEALTEYVWVIGALSMQLIKSIK